MGVPMFIVHDCFEYDGICPGLLAAVRWVGGGVPAVLPSSGLSRGAARAGEGASTSRRYRTYRIQHTTSGSNDPAVFTITEKDPTY